MSEVLDQSEIDALLSSVGEEEAYGGSAGLTAGVGERPTVNAQSYDFKRPERVSKDQIRALASIHEVFARNFGATLSGMLRTIIEARVVGVEQLTYNEFTHSLPNPTCLTILRAPPLEGQMCLELSPLIVYPLMDRMLGGSSTQLVVPQRPLTSIEWRLIQRVVNRALDHLSEVWRNLVDAHFELADTESNPQLVHIVAPTEVVVLVTFEIRLGEIVGTMSLCVPFNTIEQVLTHLTTQSWFYKPKPATELQQRRLLRNLTRTVVPLTVYLGRTSIRLSALRGLRPGDLIQLDKRIGQDLVLQVGGRNKFAGQPGQYRGQRALRVTRRAEIDEPL